ncbi:MAG: transcription elongation factor GreA [Gammaproteobacteria bacterium]|nr:transcription elongation factor GreA [Gammaproteobacteria bacterium]MCY4218736.1 transcription elongation factor GreA [Gammaproteobacteria bacterium]MCY4273956.1 transcription elongation factor GreA [Gammaproteobacteria bacterium]
MTDRILLTKLGAQSLHQELKKLKSEDRPRIISAIAEARAHGDLSENAEYHAAKEQQGFIEARIKLLESTLSAAEVIDPAKIANPDKVFFGAMIELYDVDRDTTVKYQLVGNLEADISLGKISISSPIGKALVGKSVGDEIQVNTPSGSRLYELVGASYENE